MSQSSQDSRHTDILKLIQKPLKYRFFPKWSMAFQHIVLPEHEPEGFSEFLSEPYSSGDLGPELNEGLFLLLAFKKRTQ